MKKNKQYLYWGLTAFLVILCSLLANYIINNTSILKSGIGKIFKVLVPVIDGLVLAYILTPLLNKIERQIIIPFFKLIKCEGKQKYIRLLSILITSIIFILGIYAFFAMVTPQLLISIQLIIFQFPSYVTTMQLWITEHLDSNPEVAKYITNILNQYSISIENFFNNTIIPQINNIIMYVSMSVYSIVKMLWNLIIGFIISLYVLGSKETFSAQAKKIVFAIFPIETANRIISNIRFSNKTFGGFFVGKILDSIIIGFLCFIGIKIMGTPYPVLISVIIGVTNIIPFFGPFIGAIPSTLLILFVNPLQAVYFIIFVLILQQIDGNIIGPKILGNSTGLPSFWVIFSITLFGGIFGVIGMVIGVPIFAVIFAFIKSLTENSLSNKELPPETAKYLKLLYIEPNDKNFIMFADNDNKRYSNINKFLVKNKKKDKRKLLKKQPDETDDMQSIYMDKNESEDE